MHIKQLTLKNYGRFADLTIDFAPTKEKTSNVTVIVGNNGAGKSQILQALATGLSWFVNGMLDKNREGKYLKSDNIKNDTPEASIRINVEDVIDDNLVSIIWTTGAKRTHSLSTIQTFDSGNMPDLGSGYINSFNDNQKISLPIISFYPVQRYVTDVVADINDDFVDNQFTAYDNAFDKSLSFKYFFSWFREQEDLFNEVRSGILDDITFKNKIRELLKNETDYSLRGKVEKAGLFHDLGKANIEFSMFLEKNNSSTKLTTVKNAIEYFTEFKNPRIRRQPKPTMIVEKDGEELDVNQLSQGEKSLLALVGDIARRLAILNPSMDNPLEGNGVVMIDEVDLHLHPKWQHDLIDKLVKTFPNVQFILTTHSPHVISDRNDILLYALEDGELIQMPNVYGEDVNTVLTKVMDVDVRDSKVETQLNDIRRAISEQNFAQAEEQIETLAKELPTDHLELLKCRLMLAQAKLDKPSKESI